MAGGLTVFTLIFSSVLMPIRLVYLTGLVITLLLAGATVHRSGAQPRLDIVIHNGKSAGAPQALLQAVADRSDRAGLSPNSSARLLRPAVALARQDYPSSPLLTTALEGISKQVPFPKLETTLLGLQAQTERAGALVTQWLGAPREAPVERPGRTQLITSVVRARLRGLSSGQIDDSWNGLRQRFEPTTTGSSALPALAAAVDILPRVPGSASSPKTAGRLVGEALNAGYGASEIYLLASVMRETPDRHLPPGVVAARVTRSIGQGTTIANLRRPVSPIRRLDPLLGGIGPDMGIPPGLNRASVRSERRPKMGPPTTGLPQ